MAATLVRRLGLWSSIGLVIGITIGGGIFRTPAGIATRVPDPVLMLGVWVLGGVDRAVRRAGLRGTVGGDARDRRHVRVSARGLGTPVRLSLWVGAAGPDSRRRAWRHLVGLRRVLPEGDRLRSRRASRTGPTTLRPAPSFSPASPTSSACSSARCSPASRPITKFGALALLVLASFAMGGNVGGSFGNLASNGAADRRRGCSACR